MRIWVVWLLALAAVGLWGVWAAQYFIIQKLDLGWSVQNLGPWGDTFGALSSLFSALGFIAVLATIRLQQNQIRDARRDQDRINAESKEEQHRQRFDASFFELLKLLREAKNDVVYFHTVEFDRLKNLENQKFLGVDAFRAAWREVADTISSSPIELDGRNAGLVYFSIVHKRYESRFSPYFRLLYTIMFRIANDKILTEEEKIRYGNLLRSQLTAYELVLIGLNGLSTVSKDLSNLILMFRLLKYVPTGARLDIMSRYYPKEAFEGRD